MKNTVFTQTGFSPDQDETESFESKRFKQPDHVIDHVNSAFYNQGLINTSFS